MSKNSKSGYGIHNVARKKKVSKNFKNLSRSKKKWGNLTSLDLNNFINNGWKTSDILKYYSITISEFLNKLR